jgi:hypothetical protein
MMYSVEGDGRRKVVRRKRRMAFREEIMGW